MRLGLAVAAGGLLLAGLGAPLKHATAQTRVRVTMTAEACDAMPGRIKPGETLFVFTDRTRRPSVFTISGRRTRYIGPRRSTTIRLRLERSGVYRYFCVTRGPGALVRTGVVAVSP